jgi:hypothetical protein
MGYSFLKLHWEFRRAAGPMEIEEILERFEWLDGKFEREAVDAAIARREEIVPELLQILEEIADPEEARLLSVEDDCMGHLYAMYLLAQFREPRAYPLMLKIALLPGDVLDLLFGDAVTESLAKVFASVCDGNLEGIQATIENPEADEWVRSAALCSLLNLVAAGVKPREEIVEYLASLFHGKLTDRNDIVWSQLVNCTTDLCATELLPEIEKAYGDELVDSQFIGIDDAREDVSKGLDWAMEKLAGNPHRRLVDDVAKEMAWWECFKEKPKNKKWPDAHSSAAINAIRAGSPIPVKRTQPKVGRNDPCPCGSGKKYKKCCGQ